MAPACCNACRMCATTNAIGLAVAGGGALIALVGRATRRFLRPD